MADSSREPQQLFTISSGIAERVALTSAIRGVVVCRIGLDLLSEGAYGGKRRATRRAGGITGAPPQVFKDGGSRAPGAAPGSPWSAGDAPPGAARKSR